MKRLLVKSFSIIGIVVCGFNPLLARAAITYDAAACNGSTSTGNFTVNLTVGSSATIGFAAFKQDTSGIAPDTVSWGGNAMTFVASTTLPSAGGFWFLYKYNNPSSGATTVTINGGGGNGTALLCASSYNGVDTTSPMDSTPYRTITGGTWTNTVTSTADGAFGIGWVNDGVTSFTAGADTTIEAQNQDAAVGGVAVVDRGALSPPGSYTMTVTVPSSGEGFGWTLNPASATPAATATAPKTNIGGGISSGGMASF